MTEKIDVDQDAYFTFISALQKCVRRGLIKEAVINARAAHYLEPYRMYARLHTILYEECAVNVHALKKMADLRASYKEFDKLEPIVVAMASGLHSRNAIGIKNILIGRVKHSPAMLDRIEADCPPLRKLITLWPSHEFDTYRSLGIPEEYDWVVDLCQRAKREDRESICFGVPFYYLDPKFTEPTDEAPVTPMLTDIGLPTIPDCALDGHCRIGKFALIVTGKRTSLGMTPDDLKGWAFFQEGSKRNRYCDCLAPVYVWNMETEGNTRYVTDQVNAVWSERFYPTLTDIRRWAMTKVNTPTLNRMREVVAKCVS